MKYIFSLAVLIALLTFMSCKDDEVPPAIISFEETSTVIAETAGQAIIEIVLDKPAPGNIVVNYTIAEALRPVKILKRLVLLKLL